MQVLAALRLGTHLNALRHGLISVEVAARTIVGDDTAHHVADPDGILGLDREHATDLETALGAIGLFVADEWVVLTPRPGAPAGLRGPALAAAMDAGAAVTPVGGGPTLVPTLVGRAVQWVSAQAERHGPLPDPSEAEPALSQAVLAAAHALGDADVPLGRPVVRGARPGPPGLPEVVLAPGYAPRQHRRAARAVQLLTACSAALDSAPGPGGIGDWTADADARHRELQRVRDAAADALTAASRWPG